MPTFTEAEDFEHRLSFRLITALFLTGLVVWHLPEA